MTSTRESRDRGRTWAEGLASWAIPPDILDAAPVSPWGFSVAGFADRARRQKEEPTPAHAVAGEAVPDGGSVLDVGCGAGAASVPLVPPAAHLTGVDTQADMLDAFAAAAAEAGATATTILGPWPDVADQVEDGSHDVVVAQDVLYNIPDIDGFVAACHRVARHRVVLVLPTAHPLTWTDPYWQALHGIERPSRPTVDDAAAVITAQRLPVRRTTWTEPTLWAFADTDDAVAMVRTRLCLSDTRDDEIRAQLAVTPPPTQRDAVALWWDVAGRP